MTDYGEEQRNELEALESIYPDSFTGDFGGRPRRGGGRGRAALPPSLCPGSPVGSQQPARSLPRRGSRWPRRGPGIDPERFGFV